MKGWFADIATLAPIFYTLAALALWWVTERSLKVSQRALEGSQRAWVVVDRVNCVSEAWPPLEGVTVSFSNSGRSPAQCRLLQKCVLKPSNEKLDVLKELSVQPVTSNFMIAPGRAVNITIPTPDELLAAADAVLRRETLLLVIGRVEYRDGFPKPRTTVYCHSYEENKHRGSFQWNQCPENNWCK